VERPGNLERRFFGITSKLLWGLIVTLAIFTASVWFAYRNIREVNASVRAIAEPNDKLQRWKHINRLLYDAEAEVQVYAIARDSLNAGRFTAIKAQIGRELDTLRQLSASNIATKILVDRLRLLVDRRLGLLESYAQIIGSSDDYDAMVEKLLQELKRSNGASAKTYAAPGDTFAPPPAADTAPALTQEQRGFWSRLLRRDKEDAAEADSLRADTAAKAQPKKQTYAAQDTVALSKAIEQVEALQKTEASRLEAQLDIAFNDKMLADRSLYLSMEFEQQQLTESVTRINRAVDEIGRRSGQILIAGSCAGLALAVFLFLIIRRDMKRNSRLAEELEAARAHTEQVAKAKEQFLANISHEVRSPLNVILGFTEQLKKTRLDSQQKTEVEGLTRASAHLLAVINEILDYSRTESGKLTLEHIPFRPDDIICDVRVALQNDADRKGITLECGCDKNVPQTVIGDPVRLRQILLNLAVNAVKFTDKGSVQVRCTSEGADENGKHMLRFEVKDSGIGIPPERLSSIFEPFTQADESVARRFGGTGLGLTITRRLVELHGGTLGATSEEGKGSVFFARIPYEAGEEQAEAEKTKMKSSEIPKNYLAGRRMLVVDDEEMNRMLLEHILRSWGAHVTSLSSGDEALSLLKKEKFEALLIDLSMPGMSGIDTTQALRKEEALKNFPIIAVTGHASAEERERCLGAGMNAYLTKPFREQELYEVLSGALE